MGVCKILSMEGKWRKPKLLSEGRLNLFAPVNATLLPGVKGGFVDQMVNGVASLWFAKVRLKGAQDQQYYQWAISIAKDASVIYILWVGHCGDTPNSITDQTQTGLRNSHPGRSFSLSLSGPLSIGRANAHMVYMGRKYHFTSTSQS